jgi:hypothetical protein
VWGAAAGGAAVWTLAVAARVGWLRALLDLYPPSSWERVTWALIPVLLALPVLTQGLAVAALTPARSVGRAILGALLGTLVALVLMGLVLRGVLAAAPRLAGSPAAQALPAALVLGWIGVLVTAVLRRAGGAAARAALVRAAAPAGLAVALATWVFARGWVVEASVVLDRLETAAFFIAVAAGGGVGAAWTTRGAPAGGGVFDTPGRRG